MSGDMPNTAEERVRALPSIVGDGGIGYVRWYDAKRIAEEHAAAAVAEVTRERDVARARVAELEAAALPILEFTERMIANTWSLDCSGLAAEAQRLRAALGKRGGTDAPPQG